MELIKIAQEVINIEIEGLQYMASRLDNSFDKAINAISQTHGRVIICGMGKSGIIGKKIAASFASTGTPSFFMHPGEAFHGDLGMVKQEDIFIAISNSGETDELLKLLPFLNDNGNYIIAITGNIESTLAINAHCHLDITVPKEACPLQLAPTSSTTATLVMGDALTTALMKQNSFQPENFARFHPGGSLGRKLLGRVRDDMISKNLPFIYKQDTLLDIISVISQGGVGLALVKEQNSIIGLITDGDLRRAIQTRGKDVFNLVAQDIASSSPLSTTPDTSIQSAYEIMLEHKVNTLLVKENNEVIGLLKK